MEDKRTVLVVDDDPGIRETMADILNEMDFKVTTASDGYQAIDIVKGSSFDAIVMDIRTAHATKDSVLVARREGASSLLYKPIDIPQVVTLLKEG